jgi:hypothetical protein
MDRAASVVCPIMVVGFARKARISLPQFKNVPTLRALGEKSANQGSVSQFSRPTAEQRAEENSRQIRGMRLLGGIS